MDKTETIIRRYNRTAKFYDCMDRMFSERLRREVINQVNGKILEVGVGTGKNLPLYPPGSDVTGIDFSPEMLRRARARVANFRLNVRLIEMDAQNMDFPDNTFDTVVATCVFCSVPDPVKGFQEIKRVCKPGGQVILLEHVRSENPLLGKIMDILNPLTVRLTGANINRDTVANLQKAGLKPSLVSNVKGDILKVINARP
ncbi:MAG: class I SAM-dependent methyltransferase [Bacillota bacterium]